MKKAVPTFLLIIALFVKHGYTQENNTEHFEIDAMVGMHHYSSTFFHALNTVTWTQNPAGDYTEFSGYGSSILPSFQITYFFKNNVGITTGIIPITAENDLFVDNANSTNYSYGIDQFNINIGVSGRINPTVSPVSINVGSGFIIAPFNISESISSATGGSYLTGNDAGLGFYGHAAFKIKIIPLLSFKTEFVYSYIPASITLYGADGNIEQNTENLNIGGLTLKPGFTFHF